MEKGDSANRMHSDQMMLEIAFHLSGGPLSFIP
jgi:hypothetical protein